MSLSFILLIILFFLIDSVRPNNIIYLFSSGFTISRKLFKLKAKISYFCVPNLIYVKISKLFIKLKGHFIFSNKWIIVLPFIDLCTNLPWNPWLSCIFKRYVFVRMGQLNLIALLILSNNSCVTSLMFTLLMVSLKLVNASISSRAAKMFYWLVYNYYWKIIT